MSTEKFLCTITLDDPNKGAIKISHNGVDAWIPRSAIERRVTDTHKRTELTISSSLYRQKFEGES